MPSPYPFSHRVWLLVVLLFGATATVDARAGQFDGEWSGGIRCERLDNTVFTKGVDLVVENGKVILRNFFNPGYGNPVEAEGEIALTEGFFTDVGDIAISGSATWRSGGTGEWSLRGKWDADKITLSGPRGNTDCKGTLNRVVTEEMIEAAVDSAIRSMLSGDYEAVRKAIAEGLDVNARNHEGTPLIVAAAAAGHIEAIRLLIDSGAYINATDDRGHTPLIVAAQEDRPAVVKMLLELGVDPTRKSKYGFAAMDFVKSALVKKMLGTAAAAAGTGPAESSPAAAPAPAADEALLAEVARLKKELEERRRARTPSAQPEGLRDLANIEFGRYHALVIGIADYKHLPKLKTAIHDAKAVARVLEENYGFKVTLLIDPSRLDIIDAFDQYRETLGGKDNLLIYYAGHGWLDEEVDRGYWLPVDAQRNRRGRWISNATITDTLKGLDAKHVMVVADSCYSGTLVRSAEMATRTRTGDYWKRMAEKWARVAITSGGLEPVADSGGGDHSPFAKAFIDALKGNASVMDGTQLFSKMRRPVMVAAQQTPQYADVRQAGHDGGDFLFVRKK